MSTNTPSNLNIFWGCTIPYRLPFIEVAIRKVFDKLEIKIEDIAYSCCPDPGGIQSFDFLTWTTLAARNLTLAEEKNSNIVSACNGCFETLKIANYHLRRDKKLATQVNKILEPQTGRKWQGTIEVTHIMEYLINEIGLENLKKRIVKPLKGLKVTTHVGCHFTKPENIMQTDDPGFPLKLITILEDVLGIEVMPYFGETSCCGAGTRPIEKDIALDMAHNKLKEMDTQNPDGLVIICPTCFNSFDGQQKLVNRKSGRKQEIPVFHLFELIGLALGIPIEELAIDTHLIKHDIEKIKTLVNGAEVIEVSH
ncbi:MAG: CoB--CoM heterodisulfide reductase subunit B [Candidatus Heimdallarchaeota archaeon LC_3]|nr:MAG: CoB--CoM heterodisulfide reductase subunit B [Candidatus Heimdallarchaeota archaeon LC_3]